MTTFPFTGYSLLFLTVPKVKLEPGNPVAQDTRRYWNQWTRPVFALGKKCHRHYHFSKKKKKKRGDNSPAVHLLEDVNVNFLVKIKLRE